MEVPNSESMSVKPISTVVPFFVSYEVSKGGKATFGSPDLTFPVRMNGI